ncbi:MAG: hypothetical protein U0791_17885 [Gemmataceae bacterium]
MLHIIGYHNPDTMGVLAEDCEPFTYLTRKKSVSDEWLGGVMWIMTSEGKGKKRKYLLRCWYTVDDIVDAEDEGFSWLFTGKVGGVFEPMREIQHLPWFPPFLHWMGNFGRGVSELTLQNVIDDLSRLAREAGCPIPS